MLHYSSRKGTKRHLVIIFVSPIALLVVHPKDEPASAVYDEELREIHRAMALLWSDGSQSYSLARAAVSDNASRLPCPVCVHKNAAKQPLYFEVAFEGGG